MMGVGRWRYPNYLLVISFSAVFGDSFFVLPFPAIESTPLPSLHYKISIQIMKKAKVVMSPHPPSYRPRAPPSPKTESSGNRPTTKAVSQPKHHPPSHPSRQHRPLCRFFTSPVDKRSTPPNPLPLPLPFPRPLSPRALVVRSDTPPLPIGPPPSGL